jgi:exodeoxyribonuclease VII large subunit
MFSPSSNQRIISITQLNRLARSILDSEIGQVWVSAEISNLVMASSGHWYFTLKDQKAQIKAAMFKGANRHVSMKPREGDSVLIRGRVGIYEARGDYQLIVEHLEPEGEGRLKQAFEKLKQKLNADGLFTQETKQDIPKNLTKVGIITSPTGAAIQDILTVLKRRNPTINVVVYPTMVQGEQAAEQIIKAIHQANERKEVEVLIVGRGGGSLEDLWCFNDERLAHTIFNSELPVISAVGHEIDFSIADLVADVRAPTPSAAAELVSTDQNQLTRNIQQQKEQLLRCMVQVMQRKTLQLEARQNLLDQYHPKQQLSQQQQHLDHLTLQLKHALAQLLQRGKVQLANRRTRLERHLPIHNIEALKHKLHGAHSALNHYMDTRLTASNNRLVTQAHLLNTVSPLATLSRGYSISFKEGTIVRATSDLVKDDIMETQLADGRIKSRIIK